MNWGAWLTIHASMFTPAQRTSMCYLIDFLELRDLSDLNAVDEQALTYASSHKPQMGQPGNFGLMDICRFRRFLTLDILPLAANTDNAQTTIQIHSHAIPIVSGQLTTRWLIFMWLNTLNRRRQVLNPLPHYSYLVTYMVLRLPASPTIIVLPS